MNMSRIKTGDQEIPRNTTFNNVIHLNTLSGLITTRSLEISKEIAVKLAERIFVSNWYDFNEA